MEEQTVKNEWGLEDQTPKHEKSDSIILYYDGKTWDCIYNGGIWLNSIYGFDWNDIFVAGDNGVILHYDGNSWTKQESNITHSLNRIWGSSRDNVYVSGDYGTILHYNGEKWTKYNMSLYFI